MKGRSYLCEYVGVRKEKKLTACQKEPGKFLFRTVVRLSCYMNTRVIDIGKPLAEG